MQPLQSTILTPDQRLRVFVSSTLQELAEERNAVKNAIQNIHLIPVLFELGARPHAPRELYREYLAQSQIFVGIYWNRYGWIAPGETVSGLEDEYNLSGDLPKLIYIKKSTEPREERLTQLLHKIQQDDKVSYKTFTDVNDLGNLIINDLAVLLTERFNMSVQNKVSETKTFYTLPAAPNALIGREHCMQEMKKVLSSSDTRLITLAGPGGIGKTRLAIEGARIMQDYFKDGVAFIPLAPVKDASLVAETICYHLGIKIGSGNMLDSLKLFLRDKNLLLVLDNFEQVIDAAAIVDDLLMAAPHMKIIVTSRERLALSFEQVFAVPALRDSFTETNNGDDVLYPPAIELFVKRAKSIRDSFELNEQNKETIFQICHRLEGLPLAIELAAGQINMMSPQLLLQKLDHRLDVLKGNFRDIPDRQKTIRNTIEWSFDLLNRSEQDLLLYISLFNGGAMLESIEAMEGILHNDTYGLLDALLNKSLIKKQDEDAHVRFQILESVREFAIEKLEEQNKLQAFKKIQATYYHNCLHELKLQKNKIDQSEALIHLEKEQPNIRQVMEFLLETKDVKMLISISWNLWLFWWVNAHTKEGYTWLKKTWEIYQEENIALDPKQFSILATNVGIMAFLQLDFNMYQESLAKNLDLVRSQEDDELVATALLISGVVATILKDYEKSERDLKISLEKYKKIGMTTGISLALSGLGRNSIYVGGKLEEAKEYYKESIALAKKDQNEISVIICLSGFALAEAMEKNTDAKNYLRESILLSQSLHFYEALAWSLEIWALVSMIESKFIHAITLLGAVNFLRNTTHLPVWDDLQAIITDAINQLKQQTEETEFTKAWKEGADMNLDEMVAYAMK